MAFPGSWLTRLAGAARLLPLTLAASAAWADVDRAALIALSPSVLKIEVTRAQGGFSLGSGVVVAPDRVVTNCHVTRDAQQIHVLRGGLRLAVQAQFSDSYRDVCVLRVRGVGGRAIELGTAAALSPGQSVTALGYTGGGGIQNSAGAVLALHRMAGAAVIQSSNFFSSGASGGGLFDDRLRLVGLLTFRLRGGEAHYFALPGEWIAQALAQDDRSQPVGPLAPEQRPFWEQPIEAQPNFLRAAVMERDANWAGLRPLASDWARADASDPEPWYFLGLALARLGRAEEARHAFECSLAAAPGYAPAQALLVALKQPAAAPEGAEPVVPAARPCAA